VIAIVFEGFGPLNGGRGQWGVNVLCVGLG
jgi:hypothetical protein